MRLVPILPSGLQILMQSDEIVVGCVVLNCDTLVAESTARVHLPHMTEERPWSLDVFQAILVATWPSHGYAGAYIGISIYRGDSDDRSKVVTCCSLAVSAKWRLSSKESLLPNFRSAAQEENNLSNKQGSDADKSEPVRFVRYIRKVARGGKVARWLIWIPRPLVYLWNFELRSDKRPSDKAVLAIVAI